MEQQQKIKAVLWSRYHSPQELLRTFDLSGAINFISYTLEQDQEELLWNVWLHIKPTDGSKKDPKYLTFEQYKKKVGFMSTKQKKVKHLTVEQEKAQLDFAAKFIKTRKDTKHG